MAALDRLGFLLLYLGSGLPALGGCVGPPPVRVAACHGEVRASDPVRAAAVARDMDALDESIHRILPGLLDAEMSVWLQPRPRPFLLMSVDDHVTGMTVDSSRRIHLAENAPDLAAVLAHELVHARLGDDWDALPPIIEEGLCDQIANRLRPDDGTRRAARLLPALNATRAALRIRVDLPDGGWSETLARLPAPSGDPIDLGATFGEDDSPIDPYHAAEERATWYGLGFVAAGRLLDRLGPDGLHALCLRTRDLAPTDRSRVLAGAAGLDDTARSWHQAIEEQTDERARAVLLERAAAALAPEILAMLRAASGPSLTLAAVDAASPRIRLGAARAWFDLRTSPAFQAEFARLLAPETP